MPADTGTLSLLFSGVRWPPGWCGRTGDSRTRLLFGHWPS